MRWFEHPMLGFDLETTTPGERPDPEQDLIVSFCFRSAGLPLQEIDLYEIVNPGVPIAPGSTDIHGITDEIAQLQGCDPVKAVTTICGFLFQVVDASTALAGMNISYDLTVTERSARRQGDPINLTGFCPVLDLYVLDKAIDPWRRGSRKLAAICEHYGVRHDGAHNAREDVMATLRCLWKIGRLTQGSHVELHAWYDKRRSSYAEPNEYRGSLPYGTQMRELHQLGEMTLSEVHAAQMIWRMDQQLGLQQYLRTKGGEPDAVCDGRWPVIPYAG